MCVCVCRVVPCTYGDSVETLLLLTAGGCCAIPLSEGWWTTPESPYSIEQEISLQLNSFYSCSG